MKLNLKVNTKKSKFTKIKKIKIKKKTKIKKNPI